MFVFVPKPQVTWIKRGGPLSDNLSMIFHGFLLLQNVSLEGIYICNFTNALRKAVAISVLHLIHDC
jgi:hypothetical protein